MTTNAPVTKRVFAPAERLIVAADFKPESGTSFHVNSVRRKVLALADSLKETGVYIKVNSILRAGGYSLINEIHDRGLRVFADLKLIDIGETLEADGAFIREYEPELLTVMCSAGETALKRIVASLAGTSVEILGVTVPTSFDQKETLSVYGCSTEVAVMRLANVARVSGLGGLISSPIEASTLKYHFGDEMTINTPGIRPVWAIVPGDDQNRDRVMTPTDAINAGSDRIVVGRPILNAMKPRDAVMRTLEEISRSSVV